MRTIRRKFIFLSGALCLVCLLVAAGLLLRGTRAHAAGSLPMSKSALELEVGESDLLEAEGSGMTWWSDDESVATVTTGGVVKGVRAGETTIHAQSDDGEGSVRVIVVEKKKSFDDNILISVFWPPTAEYMNGGEGDERWDEQFSLMSEAGIDYLCNVTGRDRQQNASAALVGENSKETNLKMAEYAYRYGMRVSVADTRFGTNFLGYSTSEINAIIGEYRNVPGVGGYYILDEPFDPMPYADVYNAIKMSDPNGYAHLNFQPIHAYGNPIGTLNEEADERYRNVLREWLQVGEDCGYPQDYLMFDFYPFTDTNGGMARDIYFANLDAVREVALEYGVKTANYLQSVSSVLQSNGALSFRSASPAEIRYEAMTSLAYGYKQLSYFTWFLPTNRNGETFSQAIVDADGVPNPKYYQPLSALNAEIHALGKTLIKLDSLEVYLNGTQWGWQEEIPEDFVVRPADGKDYTVSLLRNRETGRNYLMIVNNDFSGRSVISLRLDGEVRSLERVSPLTGELEPVALGEGNSLVVGLEAGDGVLYALPEGVDFTRETATDRSRADALLSRAEAEREHLAGKDVAALDELLDELRTALGGEHTTQEYLDSLAAEGERMLDALLSGGEQDDGGETGDPTNPNAVDPTNPNAGGCGTISLGGGGGGGIALGLLCAAAICLCLGRGNLRKRR